MAEPALPPELAAELQQQSNELTLSGYRVLRFPAFVVRDHPEVVAAQIADALRKAGELC